MEEPPGLSSRGAKISVGELSAHGSVNGPNCRGEDGGLKYKAPVGPAGPGANLPRGVGGRPCGVRSSGGPMLDGGCGAGCRGLNWLGGNVGGCVFGAAGSGLPGGASGEGGARTGSCSESGF